MVSSIAIDRKAEIVTIRKHKAGMSLIRRAIDAIRKLRYLAPGCPAIIGATIIGVPTARIAMSVPLPDEAEISRVRSRCHGGEAVAILRVWLRDLDAWRPVNAVLRCSNPDLLGRF